MLFLRKRLGGTRQLAQAMNANPETVSVALATRRGAVSAGIALRAARAAGVPLEQILSGEWPPAGMCPHCGRASSD
ncbi:MAG: transcriptional regulator [Deltaproteobacteria bacterium]|nr:transcriptional regulator [Deltaproteobacteria bacterium]